MSNKFNSSFDTISRRTLFKSLQKFALSDLYLEYFSYDVETEDFLIALERYGLVFLASDKRILLTNKGEKLMIKLNTELI
jgi:hypothetical protein